MTPHQSSQNRILFTFTDHFTGHCLCLRIKECFDFLNNIIQNAICMKSMSLKTHIIQFRHMPVISVYLIVSIDCLEKKEKSSRINQGLPDGFSYSFWI